MQAGKTSRDEGSGCGHGWGRNVGRDGPVDAGSGSEQGFGQGCRQGFGQWRRAGRQAVEVRRDLGRDLGSGGSQRWGRNGAVDAGRNGTGGCGQGFEHWRQARMGQWQWTGI